MQNKEKKEEVDKKTRSTASKTKNSYDTTPAILNQIMPENIPTTKISKKSKKILKNKINKKSRVSSFLTDMIEKIIKNEMIKNMNKYK